MPKKIDYIYENESDGILFWIKSKWNQLFRRSNEKDNPVSKATSELEYLSTDRFERQNMSDKYKDVFKNYLPEVEEEEEKKDISLKDISDIAESIKPKKKDSSNANNFYDKISEPLQRLYLMKANALEFGEEEQERYNEECMKLIDSADNYINTHNPYTKEGKQRVDFAVRLKFMLKQEAGISIYGEDDELDEEQSYRESIEAKEALDERQIDELSESEIMNEKDLSIDKGSQNISNEMPEKEDELSL